MSIRMLMAATLVAAGLAPMAAEAGPVLDQIKKDGKIICIVNPKSPGFSVPDAQGVFQGFNVDFCRMAAAAIFGDASKVDIRGVGFSDSLKTLVAGGAHMASRSLTVTGTRDADPGLAFITPTFFDGQGFMVAKSMGLKSASELNGATVCAEEGSTTLLNLADWFSDHKIKYQVENFTDMTARLQAFFSGKCDVMSNDFTALAANRQLAEKPDAYELLPDMISSEPLALVSRPDTELQKTLFWSFQVMLTAEQYGINQKNIGEIVAKLSSQPAAVQRLFGDKGAAADMATKLGIAPNWTVEIIRQVGNYADVFDRHLGPKTALAIDRAKTPNRLVKDGGLLITYPIR
ncbi:transporter substrate-binding domain-containing protein [Siculibacillus lacustris]|uniref:Transporter substrate-binding domain-containing protein n=1 Tax=Siculibacillus lacustris TaxID=1549641 RepID=A0A4Q9VZ36_9HYPH|nr:transporter substrate-binding domain-containing protein [Siculibacillus lacustris]TBW40869.1 transporter substrate-binding domain-containing protein [Siculibacillus lacustris]